MLDYLVMKNMLVDKMAEDKNLTGNRKTEDSNAIKPYLTNIDDNKIFRDFRDRFKTWEQIRTERYLC